MSERVGAKDATVGPELKVFISGRESTCGECKAELAVHAWIWLAGERGALCLACADLDCLEFLPTGDAALTRRARRYSTLSAVVLKWSKARKRYERQGLLVEEAALERAEAECLADADARARRREREAERRATLDAAYVARFAERVRQLFRGAPWSASERSPSMHVSSTAGASGAARPGRLSMTRRSASPSRPTSGIGRATTIGSWPRESSASMPARPCAPTSSELSSGGARDGGRLCGVKYLTHGRTSPRMGGGPGALLEDMEALIKGYAAGRFFLRSYFMVPSTFQEAKSAEGEGLHVAIIMDGNGRWARERGWPRVKGHQAGARTVRKVIEHAPGLGIRFLTLYAFSSDNWQRPEAEIAALMRLFREYLHEEAERCVQNGVRLSVIGRRDRLGREVVEAIRTAERHTREGRVLHLQLAIDYSARDGMVRAVPLVDGPPSRQALAHAIALANHADPAVPPVDLLIRTGKEQRLSDFLLWELAYAELHFSSLMWPEFSVADLGAAVQAFRQRDRRFGRVS